MKDYRDMLSSLKDKVVDVAGKATVAVTDVAGKAVSDEHRLLCDMTAPENDQRVLRTTFRLLGSGYDRSAEYWLVLRDEEAKCDLERIPFHIDIVFENDFDF